MATPPLFDPMGNYDFSKLNNVPGKSLSETNSAAALLKAGANKDAVALIKPSSDPIIESSESNIIDQFNNSSNTGMSASFLGDTEKALTDLNTKLSDRIEAGRTSSAAAIKNSAAITREEIQQNQAEGNRQIGYAQERLGGSVVLRRNIEDFTAGASKFHADIDRSLERLDIEMNTALAANDNNAWTQMFNIQKEMYNQKLQMYDRAMDVYYKNATLALQQHDAANKELDTMLQWASLDNATPEDLKRISDKTGISVPMLQSMGATAQQTFNASMTSKKGTGVIYPSALVPWQGSINRALEGGASAEDAVQQAITDAHDRGVELSNADISSLSEYAKRTLEEAKAEVAAAAAAKSGAGAGKTTSQYDSGGNLKEGSFKFGTGQVLSNEEILSRALFGTFTVDESGKVKRK